MKIKSPVKRCVVLAVLAPLVGAGVITAKSSLYTSQTYLLTQPAYQNVGLVLGTWGSLTVKKCGARQSAFRLAPFYQKSRDWPCIAAYFLLDCKSTITIAGDSSASALTRDVRAEWLELTNSELSSTLTLNPVQRQAGAIITLNQDLQDWFSDSVLSCFWLELDLPILKVKNNIKPCSPSQDVLDAFHRPDLDYAQMTCCTREKKGIAEIKGVAGVHALSDESSSLDFYLGLGAPGESHVKPDYLFNPVLGSNGHWSFIAGLMARFPLYECPAECNRVRWFADMEMHYYFHNHQCRTFDLFHRPWSRYLLLRPVDPATPTKGLPTMVPAANLFTQRVKVKPHALIDLATGFTVDRGNFSFECAYGLWTHHGEQLEWPNKTCCDQLPLALESYGIADTTPGSLKSASTSTIKELHPDPDNTFVRLHATDLDLCSGAARGVASNRLQASLSYRRPYCNSAFFLAAGGSVNFPHTNTALQSWLVWATVGYEC